MRVSISDAEIRKSDVLALRLPSTIKNMIVTAARERNMSVSDFVVEACLRYIDSTRE